MDNFAKAAGLTVEYVRYDSSKDFSKEFSQGGYDCIIGLPINASYNAKLGIVTSNPYMTSSTLSFSRPNQVSSVAEAESVALLRGSELAQLFPDKEILYYDTTEECISAVVRGKADVGCGNQYSLEYYAHKSFVNLNMVPLTDQEKNMEISVSRDNASTLLPILNRYILNLNDNDIYAYHTDVTTVTEVSWLKGLILASPLRTIIVSLCLVFIVVSSILLFFFWRLSRRENAALNSANNAKSEFLSRVSHDMRTPMNAIISFSDPQIEKSSTREDLLSDMAKINLSGQYLLGLINDVLDMSKIENAKVVLKVEPTDIDALFHSVSAAVSPIMKEKEIQFSLKVIKPEVPLTLSLDILRVKQIFINLLSNGAKFTPNQGRVNCTVNILPQSDTTAQLQIVVEDNGIGMSEEFQEQMFEPFAQEHQDHSGGSLSGTGLGLAIVKRLVDLMDGT
ncbi:MAG: ATP-binding protein, partial [Anaerovoracaceae bacterium]